MKYTRVFDLCTMWYTIKNILQEENSRKAIPGDVTTSKTEVVVAVMVQLTTWYYIQENFPMDITMFKIEVFICSYLM